MITVGNEPAGTGAIGCRCDTPALIKEGRCEVHARMMQVIYLAIHNFQTSPDLKCRIWQLQDGYGEPGYVPPQGYDWSGIRDSSAYTVERMYRTIIDYASTQE